MHFVVPFVELFGVLRLAFRADDVDNSGFGHFIPLSLSGVNYN
jgi:hypothetical protein